jgi:hypothetical protein
MCSTRSARARSRVRDTFGEVGEWREPTATQQLKIERRAIPRTLEGDLEKCSFVFCRVIEDSALRYALSKK